jgi:hypothetical protein
VSYPSTRSLLISIKSLIVSAVVFVSVSMKISFIEVYYFY